MFAGCVSHETAFRATFNYHVVSYLLTVEGKRFNAYHTRHPSKPEPNLLVVQSPRGDEMYFRVFLGKHSGECESEEEAAPFYAKMNETVSPEFLVEQEDLERRILDVVLALEEGKSIEAYLS